MELNDLIDATLICDVVVAPGIRRTERLTRQVRIIGKEWGWWLKVPQSIYTISCPYYDFSLKATEEQLINCTIRINGTFAKVLTNEEIKVK